MEFLESDGARSGLYFGATSGVMVLSFILARAQKASPVWVIAEHMGIAIVVVVLYYIVGDWVGRPFG